MTKVILNAIKNQGNRKVCYTHSPSAIVLYKGIKCPFCEYIDATTAQKQTKKDGYWNPNPQISYGGVRK